MCEYCENKKALAIHDGLEGNPATIYLENNKLIVDNYGETWEWFGETILINYCPMCR